MVKKGMTRKEISIHLKDLKSPEAKFSYLSSVLQKSNLLSDATRHNVINAFHDIKNEYQNSLTRDISSAMKLAKQYKKRGRMIEAAETYASAGLDEWAAEIYDNEGVYDRAAESYILAKKGMKAKLALNKERSKQKSLSSKVTAPLLLAIISLGLGVFFLQPKITGNAIVGLSTTTTSWLGSILLVGGLIAGFFWARKKKN